ncbi:MAG TPA: TatD family deoxyribonuclease [Actinobacteria bacterium]|nr:TatD family deoxyribonuclease [Actinomycetota bacterium]
MGWVDTHCHLFLHPDPAEELLARAEAAGVDWVLCPGIDAATAVEARDLAAAFPDRVRWSAGLHPHEATRWSGEVETIAALAADADAVGECGLDHYRELAPREVQRIAFAEQVALAAELGKPVVVHCRDAFAEVYEVLADAEPGPWVVLHSWTGGRRWTRRFAELGVTFSFSGIVTYPTAGSLREAVDLVDPASALVETDTPYLTPEPRRRDRNEPRNVVAVGEVLADLWGLDVAEVARLTSARAEAVFGRRP